MHREAEIDVSRSVDHLFRHNAGRMVAVLSRIFGLGKLDLIEDAVQDALVTALKRWPYSGVPDNPTAWLTQVAKNRMLDRLRRDSRSSQIDDAAEQIAPESDAAAHFESEIVEDQLRMIFACCSPAIAPDSQVALTLKIVSGFSIAEIARAFLAKEETIAKMLTRAKIKLRSGAAFVDIPASDELNARLDAALKVLYLMFNEGYTASEGASLIRRDLCFEAIRLCELLAAHSITGHPKVHAAAALFLFQASRLDARTDDSGELILLADQNRERWDKRLIARALGHFRLSANGDQMSNFHLEAEVAAHYSLSDSFESIDWDRILKCYDKLQATQFSAVVELNRIVVIGRIKGAAAALAEVDRLAANRDLSDYNLFHITRAHFLTITEKHDSARKSYDRAMQLTRNESVRQFVASKLANSDPRYRS